jgi:hypothetical protein
MVVILTEISTINGLPNNLFEANYASDINIFINSLEMLNMRLQYSNNG